MGTAYVNASVHRRGAEGTTLIKFMSLLAMINAIVRPGCNFGSSREGVLRWRTNLLVRVTLISPRHDLRR